MNTYYQNNPSEMLTLLLDGELSEVQQELLYKELATNTSLQKELEQMIAIREAVRNDVEAFSPPAQVTASLFNKLGYNPVTAFVAPKPTFWAMVTQRRVAIPVVASLLLFLASALYFTDNTIDDLALNTQNHNEFLVAVNDEIAENNNRDIIESKNVNSEKTTERAIPVTSAMNTSQNLAVDEVVTTDLAQETSIANNNRVSNTVTAVQLLPYNNVNSIYNTSSDYFAFAMPRAFRFNNQSSSAINNWEVSAKGFYSAMMSDAPRAVSGNNNTINSSTSLSIALLKPTSQMWSMGVEMGYEQFNLYGLNTDEISLRAESPWVFWLGASARHNMDYIKLGKVTPYLQTTLGGSTRGMLAKGSAGLNYQIMSSMSFIISYDAGLLLYNVQSDTFTSRKSGLSAGINIKF